MKNIVVLFLFISSYVNAQMDTLSYIIKAEKIDIGNLTVKKTQDKNSVKIHIESDVDVTIFININVNYQLDCTYINNELVASSVMVRKNGNIHSTRKIIKDANYYEVTYNNVTSKYYNTIDYSGALLYFIEPTNISSVFSDFDIIEKSIKNIGVHTYQTTNPKSGQKNDYFYRNGVLQKAVINHPLMTFFLVKEEECIE